MKMNEEHIQWLKAHCPFYDSYALIGANSKDEKFKCVIDRRYPKLQYHVFAMILEEATQETEGSQWETLNQKLKNPDLHIKRSKDLRESREKEGIKTTGTSTEGLALKDDEVEAVKDSLEKARQILFEAEEFDLPLHRNAGWNFCVDLKYKIIQEE